MNDATIARRKRLHQQYAEYSGLVDASRLALLNGPRVSITDKSLCSLWKSAPSHIKDTEVFAHIYVHVPFCKSICSFCNYERLRPSSPTELENYTENVLAQIALIAPYVSHLTFSSIYFGGGTPSVLSAKHLDVIMGALDSSFQFHHDNGRHMEFDPAVMNAQKLAVARKYGFEKFSFGIQSLDDQVNKAHNRGPQSRKLLQRRFQELRSAQVPFVSCDILLGLEGTTPEQMLVEIEELLQEDGHKNIDIFMLTPTESYVSKHFEGDIDRFWNHLKRFEERVLPRLPEMATRYGYNLYRGAGHTMSLTKVGNNKSRAKRSYCPLSHQQKAPVHVLGFGPSARSSIFGALQYQNMREDGRWFYEGHHLTYTDEARIHLCYDLRDRDTIDEQLFYRLHGALFSERFPLAQKVWSEQNLLHGNTLKSQGRTDRTRSLMWLVEEEKVEQEVARHLSFARDTKALRRYFHPLYDGAVLPGGSIFEGIDSSEVLIRIQGRVYPFRIAPPFEKEGLRLISKRVVLDKDRNSCLRALKVLQKLAKKNREKMMR